jgi:hypothetical protein
MNREEPKPKKNEEKPKSSEMHYEPVGGSHVPGHQPGQHTNPPQQGNPAQQQPEQRLSADPVPAGAGWGGGQKQDSGQQQVIEHLQQMMKILWQIKAQVAESHQAQPVKSS